VPLAGWLAVLIIGFGIVLLNMWQSSLNQSSLHILEDASDELAESMDEQSQALAALGKVFINEDNLRDALKSRDRQSLIGAFEQIFTQLRKEHGITHFYFHRPDQINLLRVHKPEKNGDLIDRFTAREAQRTGKTASGIELGPMGTFTLRMVQPVFDSGRLIGYLELGKEIEDILADIHEDHGVELAVCIHKKALDRTRWQAGMAMLGRKADWDRYDRKVIIYSSLPRFPSECDSFVGEESHTHHDVTAETEFNGKLWHVLINPLTDVSGTDVGDLIILYDISEAKMAFNRLFAVTAGVTLLLLTTLIGFLYLVLRRTDQAIREQQEEVLQSRDHYQSLVSNIPGITYRCAPDKDWTMQYISANVSRISGYPASDFINNEVRSYESIIHREDTEYVDLIVNKAIESGKPWETEYRICRRDGGIRWVYEKGRGITGKNGEVEFLDGFILDITVRRQIEEKLRKSEAFQRALSEALPDFIFVLGTDGTIRRVNRVHPGHREEDVVGQKVSAFIQPENRDAFGKAFQQALDTGQIQTVETMVELPDGQHYFLNRLNPMRLAEEERSVVFIATDITERRQNEDKLREVNEHLRHQTALAKEMATQAEAASIAKSEFLANMSHEIRTPMNAVLGFMELTLEDPLLSASHRQNLATSHKSGKSLLSLINDILDLSKLESGSPELECRAFDLSQVIRNTLQMFEVRASEKGIFLSLDIHPDLPPYFTGDPDRLRQILINLVGNAVKFTEKGRVSVSVTRDEDDSLHFAVSDTGIGIAPDRLDRIFAPFTQADSSTSRKFGGTGLGTTISKELAELMGGHIWAESEIGKGSTFHFTVRIKVTGKKPDEETEKPDDSASRPHRRLKILLAEDIEENITLTKIRMEQHGHSVIVARNGREAVETFAREASVDVILMDVQMPEMDGLEAAQRIREAEARHPPSAIRSTPIIALTASLMKSERDGCMEAGMDAVVGKPVDFDRLFATIRNVLPDDTGEVFENSTAADHTEAELPVIDGVDMKAGIRNWQEPEALINALISFAHDYRDAADKISRLLGEGDTDGAYRIAHALKGVSGNLSVTHVFEAAEKLGKAIREKSVASCPLSANCGNRKSDHAKSLIRPVREAMDRLVASVHSLEKNEKQEKTPEKEADPARLGKLLKEMLDALDQYNPTLVEPFLSELSEYLPPRQVEPIRNQVMKFNFRGARHETGKLALSLGLKSEA